MPVLYIYCLSVLSVFGLFFTVCIAVDSHKNNDGVKALSILMALIFTFAILGVLVFGVEAKKPKCEECGQIISDDWTYCAKCGKDVKN